jgi:hypothetical protein
LESILPLMLWASTVPKILFGMLTLLVFKQVQSG